MTCMLDENAWSYEETAAWHDIEAERGVGRELECAITEDWKAKSASTSRWQTVM
jgi:hypothetical protein